MQWRQDERPQDLQPKACSSCDRLQAAQGPTGPSPRTLLMLPLLWPIAAAFAAILLISMLQRALGSAAKPAGGAAPSRRPAFWRRSSAAARCG